MNRITAEVTSEDDNSVKILMSLINDQEDVKIEISDKDLVGEHCSTMGNFSASNIESIIQYLQMFLNIIRSKYENEI